MIGKGSDLHTARLEDGREIFPGDAKRVSTMSNANWSTASLHVTDNPSSTGITDSARAYGALAVNKGIAIQGRAIVA
jgi:hypothetical protein